MADDNTILTNFEEAAAESDKGYLSEKETMELSQRERLILEADYLNELTSIRRLEYEVRNLKLLKKIQTDFGSLEAFKEDRLANLQELHDLTDFMASINEGDKV